MSGAPRTRSVRIASATASTVSRSEIALRRRAAASDPGCGPRRLASRRSGVGWSWRGKIARADAAAGLASSGTRSTLRPLSSEPPMPYTTLLFDVADGIARITINRPDKLNALNARRHRRAGRRGRRDRARRRPSAAVVLTGAGPKAFVAGADIARDRRPGAGGREGAGAAQASGCSAAWSAAASRSSPRSTASPSAAAASSRWRAISGSRARARASASPRSSSASGPGYGGTVRLPRLVGRGRALELLLTGAMIDAQEALADRPGEPGGARRPPAAESEQLLPTILENGPLAVRACLEAGGRRAGSGAGSGPAAGGRLFGLLTGTADMREGTGGVSGEAQGPFTGA